MRIKRIAGPVALSLLAGAAVASVPRTTKPEAGGALRPRIEVIAGSTRIGDGQPATAASLAGIGGLAVDARGDLYLSEIGRNRIRKVDARTGKISTVVGADAATGAGNGDILTPGGLALGDQGKSLYFVEVAGKRVLRLDIASGAVSDLGAPSLGFGQPVGILWTPEEGLLVVDTLEAQVWRHDSAAGRWSGLFSDRSEFARGIRSVARDAAGNLLVSEFFGNRILRWDRQSGQVRSHVGTGRPGRSADGTAGAEAEIKTPDGMAFDARGDLLFSDLNNGRIAKVEAATGRVVTVFESRPGDGLPTWTPGPLALDAKGNVWVGDVYRNRVLRFRSGSSRPEVVAGGGGIGDGGAANRALLAHPGRLALDGKGGLYISDAMHHRVRRVDLATGKIETVAGVGTPGYNGDGILGRRSQLNYPGGLVVDQGRGVLYIGDYYNNRIRALDLKTGMISTVAGNGVPNDEGDGGPAGQAAMLTPHALTLLGENRLIATSAVGQSVRSIDLGQGTITSVELDRSVVPPHRVLVFYGVAPSGNGFYLADGMRNSVLFFDGAKTQRVISGSDLNYPMDVAVSPGGELYVCDTRNDRVVRWTGSGIEVVLDGLRRPRGIVFDGEGNLYVADTFNNRVVRMTLPSSGRGTAPAP